MATYKRRIVYLSDEEWEETRQRAGRMDLTISAYLRGLIVRHLSVDPLHLGKPLARDAFAEFRPVPKPGRK